MPAGPKKTRAQRVYGCRKVSAFELIEAALEPLAADAGLMEGTEASPNQA